jgi:hypothetical protein
MDNKGYRHIPEILFHWITFLTQALPIRSVPTFIELLIGAMLTPTGFVTEAWLVVDMKLHWTSYYKWLQNGRWSWVALAKRLAKLVIEWFPCENWYLVIDDTVVLRCSKKAPDVKNHMLHGCKENRPQFVRGQGWVTLSVVVHSKGRAYSIPLISRLSPTTGNRGNLRTARVLLRLFKGFFTPATVLIDCWFMKGSLVMAIQKMGYQAIGQVRFNIALFDPVTKRKRTGRPPKYGKQYSATRINRLPERELEMTLYGKKQIVRYRTVVAHARFLKGQKVRAVWVRLVDRYGAIKPARLLISTDTELDAVSVIERYAKRWSIEPMFQQLKNSWGMKDTWQQSRQVLQRWVQILSTGYALVRLLACYSDNHQWTLVQLTPWRKQNYVTAGLLRLSLLKSLSHLRVRDWWDAKSRKFEPPG